MDDGLRVASWNVNGLRACAKKGFLEWLEGAGAHVVGVQEVRALPHQLDSSVRKPPGWHTDFVTAERPGYSGVGLFARHTPDRTSDTVGRPMFDREGRVLMARFGKLLVVNCYFPNGNGTDRDNSRVPYKLRFYRHLFRILEPWRAAGDRIVVMGDFNTAHREIDLARPKQNRETSGFLPEERQELDRWLAHGWVDTFRSFDERPGNYTWWSQRRGVRERNIGWRIDYILASPAAMDFVEEASIHSHVRGSDHCPISVDLRADVTTR
jgi:exodeoxyribonuclease-3